MPKIAKIIGPPGTGKTTYLLEQIQRAAQKYYPERIGAVSYTKAAVTEMVDRVIKTTSVTRRMVKNIRTVHSLCFELLKLKTDQVAEKQAHDFNEKNPGYGFSPNNSLRADDLPIMTSSARHERNNELYRQMQVLRNRLVPQAKWPGPVIRFYELWSDWMHKEGLVDFTGMIETACRNELKPDIDVLFVDECQDTTPLQLSLLKIWSLQTDNTIYVGDSDQAIFRFSGAVPEAFRDLEHDWQTVLSQSYRVPKAVHEYAQKIIGRVKARENAEYKPVEAEGRLLRIKDPDLSLEGSHMILARCNYQLRRWREFLLKHKRVWHNPYRPDDKSWNPLKTKAFKSCLAYFNIKNSKTISLSDLKTMIAGLRTKTCLQHGAKKVLEGLAGPETLDVFDLPALGFTPEFMSFELPLDELFKAKGGSVLQSMIEQGYSVEDLKSGPVTIGTIHSVKGGESDNVWIDTTGHSRMHLASMDDEHRIAYVAITRAKQTVGLMPPLGYRNLIYS